MPEMAALVSFEFTLKQGFVSAAEHSSRRPPRQLELPAAACLFHVSNPNRPLIQDSPRVTDFSFGY